MAENKKKVIVYANWQSTFDKLTDEEAGKLIKHFFAYINDDNPNHSFSGPIKRIKTSKFRGVRYRNESNRFNALISINNKRISIGNYDTEIEAAEKYNEFALLHLGEKAKLNPI